MKKIKVEQHDRGTTVERFLVLRPDGFCPKLRIVCQQFRNLNEYFLHLEKEGYMTEQSRKFGYEARRV